MSISKTEEGYIAKHCGRIVYGNTIAEAICNMVALLRLETMRVQDFNQFILSLPVSVRKEVNNDFSKWRAILPRWYVIFLTRKYL